MKSSSYYRVFRLSLYHLQYFQKKQEKEMNLHSSLKFKSSNS